MKFQYKSVWILALLFVVSLTTTMAQDSVTCEEGYHLVEHAMGETCVVNDPQRVVVLDTGETDNALALNASIVGAPVGEVEQYQGYLIGQLDGVTDTGTISEPNLEVILELDPDLILGSVQRYEAIYDELSAIAPTVFSASLRVPWQDNFMLHAQALDKTEEAEQLLADYEAHVGEVQAVLGDALADTTISIVRFRPGQVRLYLKSSYIGYILQDIGLQRPQAQDEDVFSSEISLEQVQDVDADYIFITGYAQDDSELETFLDSPLWLTLEAVQNDRAIDVNDDTWIAGLGVQAANLVLDDLEMLLASSEQITCEDGLRAVEDAVGNALCLPEHPERVISLTDGDTDSLITLGVEPAGISNGRGSQTPPRYLLDYIAEDYVSVGGFFQPNLETVLELEPDVILFSYGDYAEPELIEQLSAIAPVVITAAGDDTWQDLFRTVGDAMNMEEQVGEYFEEYDNRVTEISDSIEPGLQFIVARWAAEGPQVMAPYIFAPAILQELGMVMPEEIPELQEGHAHSAPLSLETVDILDSDWAFVGTLQAEGDAAEALEAVFDNPLFQQLSVVQNDHVVVVDGSVWTSSGGPLAANIVFEVVEENLLGE